MPLVTMDVIQDVRTPAQKNELINRVAEAMVAVEGENMRPVRWVRINESKGGDYATVDMALRASEVHPLTAGKAATT